MQNKNQTVAAQLAHAATCVHNTTIHCAPMHVVHVLEQLTQMGFIDFAQQCVEEDYCYWHKQRNICCYVRVDEDYAI